MTSKKGRIIKHASLIPVGILSGYIINFAASVPANKATSADSKTEKFVFRTIQYALIGSAIVVAGYHPVKLVRAIIE